MSRYEYLITNMTNNYDKLSSILSKVGLDFDSYFYTLPTNVYDLLWIPFLEAEGFYPSLPKISLAI